MDFSYALSIKDQFLTETLNTLYMTFVSAFFAGLLGLFFGVILVVTKKGAIYESLLLNNLLDKFINMMRAIPFVIMLALVAPFTRFLVGTRIGETAALVPLTLSCFPFFSKQVEQALSSLNPSLIEAGLAMGEGKFSLIFSVYLKESLQGLIRASSITLISLIGLTTMAGTIGGGGIGKLAISVGYNRYKDDVILVSLIIILILVYSIQGIANLLIKKLNH